MQDEWRYRQYNAYYRSKSFKSHGPFLITIVLFALTPILFHMFSTSIPIVIPSMGDGGFAGDISIALGLFSIAVAIYLGVSGLIRDFLIETKKSLIDEKIAMLYGYAENVRTWQPAGVNLNFMMGRIESEVNSIGRIRKSIKDDQLLCMIRARDSLLAEMRVHHYNDEVRRIQQIFTTYYLA